MAADTYRKNNHLGDKLKRILINLKNLLLYFVFVFNGIESRQHIFVLKFAFISQNTWESF